MQDQTIAAPNKRPGLALVPNDNINTHGCSMQKPVKSNGEACLMTIDCNGGCYHAL